MHRKSGPILLVAALTVFLSAGAGPAAAQQEEEAPPVVRLPAPTAADTVRTNLWLTEALMGEIVSSFADVIPAEPAGVLLVNEGGQDSDDLFGTVASDILAERGCEVFVVAADSTVQAPVDFVFAYRVIGVELSYPEVGRTLGLWQRWVARDVSVTASVGVSRSDSGRLLYKDIVTRSFSDRVDNDDFDKVDSALYDFTTAETSGSGWQNRMEEIVVLGTLVGLIAVYFSNTGN